MMRIAYLVPSLGLQEGQGNVNLELLRRVAGAGHEIDVFTSNAPELAGRIDGVELHRIRRLPKWQLGNQMIMLGSTTVRLRPRRYDLVHADAGVTLRRADVLVCHTISDKWYELPPEVWRETGVRGRHAAAATRFKAWLEIRQYQTARAVVTASVQTAQDLIARGVEAERISVVPFGIDGSRFRPPSAKERAEARASFGIAPGTFVTCFVGPHGPRKGLPIALDALAGAEPDEHLLVAGQLRSGRWAEDAEERGLPVTMQGKLDDVRRAYWASDVLAYPSRYDAFGLAVLEAMACGLPVIVSREAGSHEIVRDAGFVLSDFDPRSLRAALDVIRRDEPRREWMGRRAREIARHRTWDEAGRILLNLYGRLTETAVERVIAAA